MGGKGKKGKKASTTTTNKPNVNNEKPPKTLNNSEANKVEETSSGNKRQAEESFDSSRKERQTKIVEYMDSSNDSGSSKTDKETNRSRRDPSSGSDNERTSKKNPGRNHSRGRDSRNNSNCSLRESSSGSQRDWTQKNKQDNRNRSRNRDSWGDKQNTSQNYSNYESSNYSRGRGSSQKFKKDTSSNWRNEDKNNSFEKPSNYKSGKGAGDDEEFRAIEQSFRSTRNQTFVRVKEVEGDLFDMSDEYSLGHCVAEDMGMGAGIAVSFRQKFKKVDQLLDQRQRTGGLAVLNDKGRFIYYLVTKRCSQGKPTIFSLFASLKHLRNHIVMNNVTKLALPQIGCGLDQLNWDEVKHMLEFMFKNIEVEIVVCIFRPNPDLPKIRNRSSKVVTVEKLVKDIEAETIILYFTDTTGTITEEMKQLNEKFDFLVQFRNARKQLGTIITFTRDKYALCGCVVRQKPEDFFDFDALHKCTVAIVRENRSKFNYYYVAFQAFTSEQDGDITTKIINIVKHNILDVDVYVCYPPEFVHETSSSRGYNNSNYRNDNSTNSTFNRSLPNSTSPFNRSLPNSTPTLNRRSLPNSTSTKSSSGSYGTPSGLSVAAAEFRPGQQVSNYNAWDDKPASLNATNEVLQLDNAFSALEPAENWDDEEPVAAPQQLQRPQGSGMAPDLSTTTYQDEYELFRNQEKISVQKVKIMSDSIVLKAPPGYLRVFFVTELIESIVQPSFTGFHLHGEILQQNKKLGEIAVVKRTEHYCFVIVQKSLSDELNERSLFVALTKLRSFIVENNAKHIAISNLTFLPNFSEMVEFIFREQKEVDITLCGQENRSPPPKPITYKDRGLDMLRKKIIALYFAEDSGSFPANLESADKKFKLRDKFNKEKKTVGVVIEHDEVDERLLFGCIVIKNNKFDFGALHRCVTAIKKQAQSVQKEWKFVGFQAHPNEKINKKIVAILQNEMSDYEITIHCPGDLANAWHK